MNTEFHTNIKNLPEGEYVTECMYSDAHAYKVVGKTACTVDVVEVLVSPDPEWTSKKEFHLGGLHGIPGMACERNFIKVSKAKRDKFALQAAIINGGFGQ